MNELNNLDYFFSTPTVEDACPCLIHTSINIILFICPIHPTHTFSSANVYLTPTLSALLFAVVRFRLFLSPFDAYLFLALPGFVRGTDVCFSRFCAFSARPKR